MLDSKLFENDFDATAQRLQSKGIDKDSLLTLKEELKEYKALQKNIEDLRATQNTLSKHFGEHKAKNIPIDSLQKELGENKANIASTKEKLVDIKEKVDYALSFLPNLPLESVPFGADENENVEIKKILTPKEFNFAPKEHFDLAANNGWIDFSRGVKIAQSRFSALLGDGASLNRALMNFMIDFNASHGFNEVRLPFMASSASMFGAGQLPKFANDAYKVENDDLYLIPTSEVTAINMYRDEILGESDLPIRMTSYSPCFRREAGSAGKDTRGMIRQHQFEKVELVSLTKAEDSMAELDKMLECASGMLETLGLPHRVVQLCTGDLGFSAAITYDLEVWLPGQGAYREVSSISNTRDFQARRAKIRYKNTDGKNLLVHTLNGSSLAIGRTIIAIMENYQDKDGNIQIPKALQKYL